MVLAPPPPLSASFTAAALLLLGPNLPPPPLNRHLNHRAPFLSCSSSRRTTTEEAALAAALAIIMPSSRSSPRPHHHSRKRSIPTPPPAAAAAAPAAMAVPPTGNLPSQRRRLGESQSRPAKNGASSDDNNDDAPPPPPSPPPPPPSSTWSSSAGPDGPDRSTGARQHVTTTTTTTTQAATSPTTTTTTATSTASTTTTTTTTTASEGSLSTILVSSALSSKPGSEPGFYNPKRRMGRDLVVLSAARYLVGLARTAAAKAKAAAAEAEADVNATAHASANGDAGTSTRCVRPPPVQVLDACCAAGVQGLRVAAEAPILARAALRRDNRIEAAGAGAGARGEHETFGTVAVEAERVDPAHDVEEEPRQRMEEDDVPPPEEQEIPTEGEPEIFDLRVVLNDADERASAIAATNAAVAASAGLLSLRADGTADVAAHEAVDGAVDGTVDGTVDGAADGAARTSTSTSSMTPRAADDEIGSSAATATMATVSISTSNAQALLHSPPHYAVTILDPYGSVLPHLDAALCNAPHNSLLELCATDVGVLYGHRPNLALRHYGAVLARKRPPCYRERGARMLLANVARAAGRHGRGVIPIWTVSAEHYCLCGVKVVKGGRGADRSAGSVGDARICRRCGACATMARSSSSAAAAVGAIPAPACGCAPVDGAGTDAVAEGPLWLGPIFDRDAVRDMAIIASLPEAIEGVGGAKEKEKEELISKRTRALLATVREEAEVGSGGGDDDKGEGEEDGSRGGAMFHRRPGVAAPGCTPKLTAVLDELKRRGHGASRTHFDVNAIRTDASPAEFDSAVRAVVPSTGGGG